MQQDSNGNNRQQQMKGIQQHSRQPHSLFPNSYASFQDIPDNLRTGRDYYLIYFNRSNGSWWYYPTFNLEYPIRHGSSITDIENFPYHEDAIYFLVRRDDLFYVIVSRNLNPNHEILNVIMNYSDRPQRVTREEITYSLIFERRIRRSGIDVSPWELINDIPPQLRSTHIQRFLDFLLPYEAEQRQRRQQAQRLRDQQAARRRQNQQAQRLRQQAARRRQNQPQSASDQTIMQQQSASDQTIMQLQDLITGYQSDHTQKLI